MSYYPQYIHIPTTVPVQRFFADPYVNANRFSLGGAVAASNPALSTAAVPKLPNLSGVGDIQSGLWMGIGDKMDIALGKGLGKLGIDPTKALGVTKDIAPTVGQAVGSFAHKLGTGNFDRGSGAGNAINGIGSAAGQLVGKFNPFLGAAVSAGAGILGGITNRAFGYHLNDAAINAINGDINGMNNLRVTDSSNESIANQAAAQEWGSSFGIHDIGNWGWFSKGKVKNQFNRLQSGMASAQNYAAANYDNAATNVTKNTMNNLLINSAAMGGFFDDPFSHSGSMAIAYGNEQQRLNNQRMMLEDMQGQYQQQEPSMGNSYGFGGCIPYCIGGRLFAEGGMTNSHGGDFTNGLMYIDEGGTHEENPYQGVPMGHDSQSVPNVVEQDEVIVPSKMLDGQGDYVLSNRIPVTEEFAEKHNIPADTTIAEAAKMLTEESRENPTDIIAQNTDKALMLELVNTQEEQKQRQQQMQQMAAQQMMAQMPPEQQAAMAAQMQQEQLGGEAMDELAEQQQAQEAAMVQQPQLGAFGGRLFGYGGPVNSFALGDGLYAEPQTVINRPAGNQYATSRVDAYDALMANRILQWAKDNITQGQTRAERLAALEQLNKLQDLYYDAGMVGDDLSTTRRSEAIGRLQDQANKMGINDVFDELRLEDYFGNHKGQLGDIVPTYKDGYNGGMTGLRTGGYRGMVNPALISYLRSMGVNYSPDPTRDGLYYAEPFIDGDVQDAILQNANNSDTTVAEDATAAAANSNDTNQAEGQGTDPTKALRGVSLLPSWQRQVPIWMSGLATLTDALGITNRPDYTAYNGLLGLANSSNGFMPVSYHPTGEQMAYTPYDPMMQTIMNQASTAASRRAIQDNANGNGAMANASLVALDRNAALANGQLGLAGRQYNDKLYSDVLGFNNGVNRANSQGIFGADSTNAANWTNRRNTYNTLMANAIAERQAEKNRADAARAMNLSNFAKSMGALGKENFHFNQVMTSPIYEGYGYYGKTGGMGYGIPGMATQPYNSQQQQQSFQDMLNQALSNWWGSFNKKNR